MNMINLLKNKFYRILNRKEVIITAVIIIPLLISVAVLFANRQTSKTSMGVIAKNSLKVPKSDKFNIKILNKKPDNVDILMGKYDVIAEQKSNGDYKVTAIMKSKKDINIIENFLNHHGSLKNYNHADKERGIGTKIIGFIIMIVLMQGVAITILYPEDRTLKTFKRILTAPVGERQYLLAQGIFTFVCVFIPTYLALVVTKVCFGVKMGFNLGMLAVLIAILTILTTAFSIFISAVMEENQSLAATGIATITCLLTGCFNSFTINNKVLNAIISVLPQKEYMTLMTGVEKSGEILNFKGDLIYIFVWAIALWLIGSFYSKSRMNKGFY